MLGIGEFFPANWIMDLLAELLCDEDSIPQICGSVMYIICGFDKEKLNETLIDTVVHHTPAGASTRTLVHYGQEIASGKMYLIYVKTFPVVQCYNFHDNFPCFHDKQFSP